MVSATMSTNNIKVAIKVRPLIPREKKRHVEEQWTVTENSIVSLNPYQQTTAYHFDHVFGKESSNRDVFEKIAHPIVSQSLEGFNGTIFAYGQTSSGKTHTMLGNDEDPGITVLAVRQLFGENESDRTFMIRVGYIEIYNEKVYDLLKERQLVTINQNGENDIKLTNKEVVVKDGETILNILAHGNKLRRAAQTNMNETSSRSHAIFRIIIESEDVSGSGPVRVSYLNLVDLAGSEKANDAGTSGTRMKEGNDINKSLLYLGIAIRALSEGKKFVDVRSSKLTRILQASLGGNANTAIVCNITPAAIEETASTLGFATQAKTVKNEAKCNEVFSAEDAFMKQMQNEVDRLKSELQQSNENEKKLRAEIAQKEATFLSGKSMRVKVDRRKTWHHMPGEHQLAPLSLIPRCQPKTSSVSSLDITPPQSDMPSTPIELRTQPSITPSPNQEGLKYRLGRIEKEYSDLKQFTALESRFDLYGDTTTKDSYIEKLEKDLKLAREEAEKYRQLSYEKLSNGINNSDGMIEPAANEENVIDSSVSKELSAAKDQISELMQQLAELQTVHEKEKQTLDQQLKAAKHAQDKAEILQAEGEITFGQYKKQTNQRINELISEVETLKVHSVPKHVDLNISKMPIKVEPENSYELTELKYNLDQLNLDNVRNKKIIEGLESQVKSITDERDALRVDSSEESVRNMKTIKELESRLEAMTEEKNILLVDQSGRNNIENLELQLKSMTEERNVIQSQQLEISARHSKTIEDLETQLKALQSQLVAMTEEKNVVQEDQSEKSGHDSNAVDLELQMQAMTEERNALQVENSELSARHNNIVKDLESKLEELQSENMEMSTSYNKVIKELEAMTEKRNILQVDQSEKSDRYKKMIEDLESQVATITDEKNVLQSEHSDLSTQIMDYIEELDEMKSKLDAIQARFDDLQRIYDENLQVIEKTEEECKTFKASLLESYDKIKISMEETESLKTKNSSLCLEVSNLKNSLDTQSGEMNDLRKKLDELQQQNLMLSAEKVDDENLPCQIEQLQEKHRAEIAEKEDNYKKLSDQVDGLREELDLKQKIVSTSSDAFNANIAVLEADIREKQKQLDTMQTTVSRLTSELDDKEQQSTGLLNDLTTIKKELREKQLQVDNCEAIISDLKSQSNEKFHNDLTQLKAELQEKQQQLDKNSDCNAKFENEVSQLKAELVEKNQLINDNDAMISELETKLIELTHLRAELLEKQQQIDKYEALNSDSNAKYENEATLLKAELAEKQQQLDKYEVMTSNLNSKFENEVKELKAELAEKSQLINSNDAMISELESKLNELSQLKAELLEKQQQLENYEAMNSDSNAKYENEMSQLKAELAEKNQLINDNDVMVSELESKLNEKFHNELAQLETELLEKQQQLDKYKAMISDLNLKFEDEVSKLKTELQEKIQLINDNVIMTSELESKLNRKFQSDLLELKVELQLKQDQNNSNEQLISKLQSELTEKDKNALSAKSVIDSLESQLSKLEPEEKRNSPKCTKANVNADRKARRYSKHDESRLWLDDSIDPPRSVSVQTDPSNTNCSCESMNAKIIELKQQVAIKMAVINTQKMEMDNHPLIGENRDLKKKLLEAESAVKLRLMDVDHYQKQYQEEKKRCELLSLTKNMASKEVQVNCDKCFGSQANGRNGAPNGESGDTISRNGVSNGKKGAPITQNGIPNGESGAPISRNGVANGKKGAPIILNPVPNGRATDDLTVKYHTAKLTIKKLESAIEKYNKERADLVYREKLYKDLAVSRRADVKRLEEELAAAQKLPKANSKQLEAISAVPE